MEDFKKLVSPVALATAHARVGLDPIVYVLNISGQACIPNMYLCKENVSGCGGGGDGERRQTNEDSTRSTRARGDGPLLMMMAAL